MGTVKATLVGVSNYDNPRTPNLEACKNDIIAVKDALVNGLCVSQRDIRTLGSSGTVNINELADELKIASMLVEADDTYFFTFLVMVIMEHLHSVKLIYVYKK